MQLEGLLRARSRSTCTLVCELFASPPAARQHSATALFASGATTSPKVSAPRYGANGSSLDGVTRPHRSGVSSTSRVLFADSTQQGYVFVVCDAAANAALLRDLGTERA